MPELPEVRTVCHILQTQLKTAEIISGSLFSHKLVKNVSAEYFTKAVQNQPITKISSYGKHLLIQLSAQTLIVHLRMEGKLFVLPEIPNDLNFQHHILAQFQLRDGRWLIFHDTRRFGTFHLLETKNVKAYLNQRAGYEPFSKYLTPTYFHQLLQNRKQNIKTVLLDQHVIAGIGNIYANEILFACNIFPLRPSNQLSISECENILIKTRLILRQAILKKGTTVFNFKADLHTEGQFQSALKVYGRQNQVCLNCQKNQIQKLIINQRGTYFCSFCQPLKLN